MKAIALGFLFLVSVPLVAQPTERAISSTCTPSATTLCLNDSRFSVTASWRKSDGSSGTGQAVILTGDTGYFWFFDASNIEVTIKVLDACGVNGSYWVFASGLTNVGVTITVTDNATGRSKQYTNQVGAAFVAVQDTQAFQTCSTPTQHAASVAGSWTVLLTVNGVGSPASLTLAQNGGAVSGTGSVYGGGGGYVSGTISGDSFSFSVNEVSPCAGSFRGSGTVSENGFLLSGSGSGTDCYGSFSRSILAVKNFVGAAPAAGSANLAGSWNVTLSVGGAQYAGVLTFVQNGNALSGTVVVDGFGNGSFVGSIVGATLAVTVNELSPCLGVFIAAANNASDSFASGSIAGSDCYDNYNGTFSISPR